MKNNYTSFQKVNFKRKKVNYYRLYSTHKENNIYRRGYSSNLVTIMVFLLISYPDSFFLLGSD